jgi:hypothetical protein
LFAVVVFFLDDGVLGVNAATTSSVHRRPTMKSKIKLIKKFYFILYFWGHNSVKFR